MGVKGFLKEATLTAGDEGTHGDMTQVEFERQKGEAKQFTKFESYDGCDMDFVGKEGVVDVLRR